MPMHPDKVKNQIFLSLEARLQEVYREIDSKLIGNVASLEPLKIDSISVSFPFEKQFKELYLKKLIAAYETMGWIVEIDKEGSDIITLSFEAK